MAKGDPDHDRFTDEFLTRLKTIDLHDPNVLRQLAEALLTKSKVTCAGGAPGTSNNQILLMEHMEQAAEALKRAAEERDRIEGK